MKVQLQLFFAVLYCFTSMICHATELPNLPLRIFWTVHIAAEHSVNLKIFAMHILETTSCLVSFLISVTPIFIISVNKSSKSGSVASSKILNCMPLPLKMSFSSSLASCKDRQVSIQRGRSVLCKTSDWSETFNESC